MKLRFQDQYHPDFNKVVKDRVDLYFQESKISKNANYVMILKTLFFIFLQIGLYAAIMTGDFSVAGYLILFSAFGIITALLDFNVVHDALHNAYASKPFINKLLGYIYDLNGTSSYVWKISHNQLHHIYTNIPGFDCDIDKADILRLNPKDVRYPFHYYQHIYAFFLYCFAAANWVFYADYVLFMEHIRQKKTNRIDIFLFFIFKFINVFWLVVLPLIWLPYSPWIILLGYLCAHIAAGMTISIVFQLAHVVQKVTYVQPDINGIIHMNWAAHEMMTTSNFATQNVFITHLIGGLNFQIEHHLFPHICHVHYPNIQKIVRQTAQEFNLPYHEYTRFSAALKSHYLLLKKLGRSDSKELLTYSK